MQVQVVIDADRKSVWRLFAGDDVPEWRAALEVTETREPDFIAGTYVSDDGNALIVSHFESINEQQTRLVCYWNLRFSGIAKLTGPFRRAKLEKDVNDSLQRFKLVVESRAAN